MYTTMYPTMYPAYDTRPPPLLFDPNQPMMTYSAPQSGHDLAEKTHQSSAIPSYLGGTTFSERLPLPPATLTATTHPFLPPPKPALGPEEVRHIPYSLPPYVVMLLGPKAERKDKDLANEARVLIQSGCKIVPPPPTSNVGDLGDWENADIVTILQAHNLRHCAVTDKDVFAIRMYRWLHTTYTNRSLRRSEGIQYLMKTFSGNARFLR